MNRAENERSTPWDRWDEKASHRGRSVSPSLPEHSTANRPVQATAFRDLAARGSLGLCAQRSPDRLQRLNWMDPNMHRAPSAAGSRRVRMEAGAKSCRSRGGGDLPEQGWRSQDASRGYRHGGVASAELAGGSLPPRPSAWSRKVLLESLSGFPFQKHPEHFLVFFIDRFSRFSGPF